MTINRLKRLPDKSETLHRSVSAIPIKVYQWILWDYFLQCCTYHDIIKIIVIISPKLTSMIISLVYITLIFPFLFCELVESTTRPGSYSCDMGSIPTNTTITSKHTNAAPCTENMANQGFEPATLQEMP